MSSHDLSAKHLLQNNLHSVFRTCMYHRKLGLSLGAYMLSVSGVRFVCASCWRREPGSCRKWRNGSEQPNVHVNVGGNDTSAAAAFCLCTNLMSGLWVHAIDCNIAVLLDSL